MVDVLRDSARTSPMVEASRPTLLALGGSRHEGSLTEAVLAAPLPSRRSGVCRCSVPSCGEPALPPFDPDWPETGLTAAKGWGAAIREGDIAAQRDVLAALIERVVPVRVGRGTYALEIVWTPLGEGLRAALDPATAANASQAA